MPKINKLIPKAKSQGTKIMHEEHWDRQIDADIKAGRLDKLADQALDDYRAGRCKPLDEILNDE